MTMKRSEIRRGSATLRTTKPMERGKPMGRGMSQLARTGPIRPKAAKAQGQRVEIKVFATPEAARLTLLAGLAGASGAVMEPAPKRKRGLKSTGPKMTAIRASAKDEECTLRFPCCNYRTDTTVLCHRNGAGAGMKAADTDAAYGCYACHTVLDGHAPRPEGFTRDMMLARFDVAVELTRTRLIVKGLVREVAGALEIGGIEKQKPTPATNRDRLQLEVTDWGSQMSTKIVPQINSVVSADARENAAFVTQIAFTEVTA